MIPLPVVALMIVSDAPSAVEFDCDRAIIDGEPSGSCENKLGQFIAAQMGPRVNGIPTIAIHYQPEWGTNLYNEAVALLQRRGHSFRILWSHELIEATAGLPGVPDEARVYVWSFDARTQRIAVRGSRTVGTVLKIRTGEARGRQTRLPAETYCFEKASSRFRRCR